MPRAETPFTPSFVPYRPSGSGWVAYHDVAPVSGPAGLAMTWRVPGEGLRWVTVLDRAHDGWVTAAGKLGEHQDVAEIIANVLRGEHSSRSMTEGQALALILPHAGNHPTLLASNGLPALDEHVALARQAVAGAEITPAMRAAFAACLDHGVPRDASLVGLRSKTRGREWPALGFAARHPELAKAVLGCDPRLLAGDDPLASLRKRWPGLTEAHLRRMRATEGLPGSGLHLSSAQMAGPCLGLLFACPVDWWPTRKEWPAFEAAASALGGMVSSSDPGLDRVPLISASKGDWIAFADRLGRAAGTGFAAASRAFTLADRGRDCADPVRALAKDLMVPLVASREEEDGVMRMEYAYGQNLPKGWPRDPSVEAAARAAQALLYGGKSAPAILEVSRRWHERQAAMQAEIRGAAGEASWPPLFEGEYRVGDVGVVAIRDYASLREEGSPGRDRDGVAGLDHCVASRLTECLSGQAHVLSVRLHAADGTWSRLSTCQVSVDRVGEHPRLSVTEHRGGDNSAPPAAAVEAVSRLSEAVLSGRLAAPGAVRRRFDPQGGSITRRCGYDWRDPEELARVVRTWEPFLPRWARGLGPDGLFDALVERDILPPPSAEQAAAPGMR